LKSSPSSKPGFGGAYAWKRDLANPQETHHLSLANIAQLAQSPNLVGYGEKQFMSKSFKAGLLGAVMLLGLAGQANAATYNWAFDCGIANCSGSGVLETDIAIGPATLTSFSGLFGGETITALMPPGSFGGNNNIIDSLADPNELGLAGLTFSTATSFVNLFYGTWWRNDIVNKTFTSGEGDFSVSAVSAVPIPAALPLFAAGLSALGVMGWRKKRKAA
jgi:hypothetical protein